MLGGQGDVLLTRANGEQTITDATEFAQQYKPVPIDVPNPIIEYRKTASVQAEQSAEPFTWTNWEGKPMQANAGDWRVNQPDGSVGSVTPEIFARTYGPAPSGVPGEYVKTALTRAQVLDRDVSVRTLEGEVKGRAGDYLATGPEGEQYPIPREAFEMMFQRVQPN